MDSTARAHLMCVACVVSWFGPTQITPPLKLTTAAVAFVTSGYESREDLRNLVLTHADATSPSPAR